VEGYRPEPLVEYELHNAPYATLKAADFADLPDSVWSKGSIDTDVASFNVVVTGASQGSVLTGFRFNQAKGKFMLRPEDRGAFWDEAGDGAVLKDSLRALVDLKGTLDSAIVSRYNDYHLFLYGTGFSSRVENGQFVLRGLPENKYEAFLITLPKKDHQISGLDSTDIFSTTLPLSTESTSLGRGIPYERVRLPESLIAH
jgi:hypothetical protein